MAFQSDAFQNDAFQVVAGPSSGSFSATIAPSFAAAFVGTVLVSGAFAATIDPALSASFSGSIPVTGSFAGEINPHLLASFEGTSEGVIVIIPRDVEGGIAYLVEVAAYDPDLDNEVLHCFSDVVLNTLPTDSLPNRHFDPRLTVPGDYVRSMFSDGTTSGSIDVGTGVIEMSNVDGVLDDLADHAFDGRRLTIRSVERLRPRYADAVTIFSGTVEQVEFTWGKAIIRLRDRLAEIDKDIQTVKFAGTTTAGGMNEAEGGPDDLKDRPKPLTYGAPMHVAAVASNSFDHIFDLGAEGLTSVAEVRDKGVALTPSGVDYATVSLLAAASVPPAHYATCLARGLIKTGSEPVGQITAAPVEGADASARTAAQIARRMLIKLGLVENIDFLPADVAALDEANGAPLGIWLSDEVTGLDAISNVLNSLGAAIVPDRNGMFRMYRLEAPNAPPTLTLTPAEILEPQMRGIERLATGDEGNGVPAWKVSVKWGRNWAVMSRNELDAVSITSAFKSFAELEWRTAVAEDEAIKDVHKLASEMSFETYFVNAADAQAEADRRLALYGVQRDRFRVPLRSYLVEEIDIGSIVRLQIPRFKLDDGKDFRVIGMSPNLETGRTVIDLWG